MKKQGNIGQGRAGHGRVKGRFSSGQDRTGVREVAVAGTGTSGLSKAGRGRAEQGGAEQDRARAGRTGEESAGQCKTQCIRQYKTQHTAGQGERHDRLRDRAEGRVRAEDGTGIGQDTALGEACCRERQA